MWGQSWIVNYGYSLILAIFWCELIPNSVNDCWDKDTTDIWDWVVAWDTLRGWFHWLIWWEFSSLFSAFLLFSYKLLFSPQTIFRFPGNCDRVSMFKINTRPASTSIFHLHFEVTCFWKIVTYGPLVYTRVDHRLWVDSWAYLAPNTHSFYILPSAYSLDKD